MSIIICLDPGHVKNYNKGAYPSYYEGTEMYNFSLLLKAEIEKYKGMSAVITRSSVDERPTLLERDNFAKAKGAKVLLSLHTNGTSKESINYAVVYGSVVLREKTDALAKKILTSISEVMDVKANGINYLKRSDGKDYYGVIRNVTNSSIEYAMIIEHSFHSNYNASLWMYQKTNQQKLAETEANVLSEFFGYTEKIITETTTNTATQEVPITTINTSTTYTNYTVKSGDSWWKIAKTQLGDGSRYKELAVFNNMSTDNALNIGVVIKIPTYATTKTTYKSYTVVKGDSLSLIALKQLGNASRYPEIATASGISTSAVLQIGMVLKIPTV